MLADGCGRAVRRSIPALVATAVVTTLGTGLWLGYRFVTTSDRFAIDSIEVHGTDRLTPDAVRGALPVATGENLITADLDAAKRALRDEPWIATADVRRQLPSTLIVEIREHTPAVVVSFPVDKGEQLYLADAAGHPFKRASDTERSDLPLITGLSRADLRRDPEATAHRVTSALDVLRQWHTADRLPIRELRYDLHGGISLIARSPEVGSSANLALAPASGTGLAIELGTPAKDLAARLRTFDAVWNELSTDEHARARTIHLDTRLDHVTISFKN